jgi:hypothetical protein
MHPPGALLITVPGELVPLYVPISGELMFGPLYTNKRSQQLSVSNWEKIKVTTSPGVDGQ